MTLDELNRIVENIDILTQRYPGLDWEFDPEYKRIVGRRYFENLAMEFIIKIDYATTTPAVDARLQLQEHLDYHRAVHTAIDALNRGEDWS